MSDESMQGKVGNKGQGIGGLLFIFTCLMTICMGISEPSRFRKQLPFDCRSHHCCESDYGSATPSALKYTAKKKKRHLE